MKAKKTAVAILAFVFSSSYAFANVDSNQQKAHYMMNGGDGPQGYNMQGFTHYDGTSTVQVINQEGEHIDGVENAHYMMNAGRGPQGQLMEGKNHQKGAVASSINHLEADASSLDKHYMMLGGDGPAGYWMKGNNHKVN